MAQYASVLNDIEALIRLHHSATKIFFEVTNVLLLLDKNIKHFIFKYFIIKVKFLLHYVLIEKKLSLKGILKVEVVVT